MDIEFTNVRIDGKVNPAEAPEGFTAVLKATHKPKDGSNICQACHWRKECQDPATDLTKPGHRCMAFPIRTQDGRTIQRQDGQSVLFIRA
jgi:hypothetical protein